MKKISILVAAAIVLSGFSTRAFADEVNTQTTPTAEEVVSYKDEAGITPDSLLYTIDKAVDQLRVMLANNEEKEAAVNADIAEERLGESEVMTDEGKIELAQEALNEYNERITEAANKLQEAAGSLLAATDDAAQTTADENVETPADENTEAVTDENTDDKLAQSITDLEASIQDVQEKSLAVLDNLKDAVPEESVKAVEDVIEEQTSHKEAVANFVKERHEFNAAKKALNMARVALKKVQKSGSEAAVKDAQDKLTAAQNEYMTTQAELQEAFQAKKAADFGVEENKEDVDSEEALQAPTEEAVSTDETTATEVTATAEEVTAPAATSTVEENNTTVKETVKSAEYIKTNNGNGNGNKSDKVKKEKSASGKSEQEHGKSAQAKGKNNK